MAKVPNAVEILPKIWTAWVGRTSVSDDRQTDGRYHIAIRSLTNNTANSQIDLPCSGSYWYRHARHSQNNSLASRICFALNNSTLSRPKAKLAYISCICYFWTRDESIFGIPRGPMGLMGIPWEWEQLLLFHGNGNGNRNVVMGGNENSPFSHSRWFVNSPELIFS